jgi:hypothetical protein
MFVWFNICCNQQGKRGVKNGIIGAIDDAYRTPAILFQYACIL